SFSRDWSSDVCSSDLFVLFQLRDLERCQTLTLRRWDVDLEVRLFVWDQLQGLLPAIGAKGCVQPQEGLRHVIADHQLIERPRLVVGGLHRPTQGRAESSLWDRVEVQDEVEVVRET